MNVSVIIPAYNAVATIAETLESLCAQTHPGWEAIVVDDGSSDDTTAVAARVAAQDARIRIVSQPHQGGSAARNKGMSLTRFDWLLFLDADDSVSPLHLERMTNMLQADPGLDAVHCGWDRITPANTLISREFCKQSGDLFAEFCNSCVLATVGCCIIRRSLAEAVGGFDTSFRTCDDWDFWQRVARTGARFGAIRDVLTFYRTRPGSVSMNSTLLLAEGLRVLAQGRLPDPRVPNPKPVHVNGLPTDDLVSQKFYCLCWCAGLMLGQGENPQPLFDVLKDGRYSKLDPFRVAENIFKAVAISRCQPPSTWVELWLSLERRIDEFLFALEARSMGPGLAHRSRTVLECMTLGHPMVQRPLTMGTRYAIQIEVTDPIPDIVPPPGAERLLCVVELEGAHLGMLELPVCDGLVPGYVLSDAIAAEFAWPILGSFFERTVYHDLRVERGPTGMSLWRGALRLADGLPEDEHTFWQQAHDRAGWEVFLQEIWGCPDWPQERFYSAQAAEGGSARRYVGDDWVSVEVSEDQSDLRVSGQELHTVLTVGGVALGVVTVPVKRNVVRAQELRAALTKASGLELCRAAVREGLLGRPMADPASLRVRLAEAAVAQRAVDNLALEISINVILASGSARAPSRMLRPGERGVVFSRHAHQPLETSISRRAMLPATAIPELVDAAAAAGEPAVWVPQLSERAERAIYAPDLILRPLPRTDSQQYTSLHKQTKEIIGENITRGLPLRLLGESRTFLHRILLFRRGHPAFRPLQVHQNGGHSQRDGTAPALLTDRLPILVYDRIASTGLPTKARFRVAPEKFEEQLCYLHDAGYYSVRLEEWSTAMKAKRPLPGKAVLITFDNGYLDFLTYAWPVLKRYGFSATVFLVTDLVGGINSWDRIYGEEVPLLGWKEIHQLQDEGVEFGSHSASHRPLVALSHAEVVRECTRSRAILTRELRGPVRAFAYPYGEFDPVIQHLIGACGYIYGLTYQPDLSRFQDPLLALPRIEVTGSDGLQEFVAKLNR